ncbi:hypothetical protein FKP32DRAFT_1594992 [Trametes sanguinea]|nr:hypothetical protein FKP32DRAFT_1594992 [Trametes sanguinea]
MPQSKLPLSTTLPSRPQSPAGHLWSELIASTGRFALQPLRLYSRLRISSALPVVLHPVLITFLLEMLFRGAWAPKSPAHLLG